MKFTGLILGKILVLELSAKILQPIRLQDYKISYISRKKLMNQLDFWHADI